MGLDLRFALRQLRRNPAFTAAAALTLTLGVAATTTVFSFVDAVLLRPLPYPEPSRLFVLWNARASARERAATLTASERASAKPALRSNMRRRAGNTGTLL